MPKLQRLAVVAALVFAAAGFTAPAARADITVDVNQGVLQPMPIAIPAFGGPQGPEIAKVVENDLEGSGLFKPLDSSTFQETPSVNVQPQFAVWKQINAQALLDGQTSTDSDGRLKVDFRLWDVFSQGSLLGYQFSSTPDNWRRLAHKISDAVYERLTGEKGYFDTRVVFVAESGPKTKRVRRLAIMDQDGANPSYMTDGAYQVFTPRFSTNDQEITFMALRDSGASIYLFNIQTGRQETLGHFSGMVFAPRFSPDGTKVALSVEKGGNTDVYVMDLRSRETRRLTTDPGIDTSPSFSPDGSRIVFNSDRGGNPQIYVMGADGSGQHRISFGEGRYTSPVWSPRGDLIAFTKQTGQTFHIGVMNADGSNEHILTSSYLDEGPTWAPNGRVIMFSRETPGGGAHLWTVDVTGRVSRAAAFPGGASDPAWSPLLP
ncbi:MAG TPA: Tol-Pal system beta propeller repeat protein TolB [Caulobacteraceae bacterium]|jgi:TolB protein|nr:Tol-Pal system beta propeller repeat protein TolB [Caulobacteraceae bacterium]